MPVKFKESDPKLEDNNWKIAQPADQQTRGEWWRIYNDAQLNELEQQAIAGNQNQSGGSKYSGFTCITFGSSS